MARQLSFSGVTFDIKEVPLSDQFIEMYNASALLVCYISHLPSQVKASCLTSCNRLVINKPIPGCVRMACDSWLMPSCPQTYWKLIVRTCYPQACCKCFQQVCNKSANDKLKRA